MTSTLESSRRKSSWLPATLYGLFVLLVVTIFAQSALAQAPAAPTQTAGTAPAPTAPAATAPAPTAPAPTAQAATEPAPTAPAPTEPAPAAQPQTTEPPPGMGGPADPPPGTQVIHSTEPPATAVQGDDLITKRALDIDSSILMREQDSRMVDHFLLAIAVFFAVIAFLLFVSLPPRKGEN